MPLNKVYNADCLPAMREMKDNQFDLAIVDPPYGIGDFNQGQIGDKKLSAKEKYGKIEWNDNIPTKEYFNELFRISNYHIIFGCQYYTKYLRDEDIGRIVHDKVVSMRTLSQVDIASCNMQKRTSLFRYVWNGMIQEDMKNKQNRIHPCEKPIALYKWLLKNYAKEGDTIFDSHVGSGSSRIACWEMGFDFEGYEIDADYWVAQEKRFNIVKNQMTIF